MEKNSISWRRASGITAAMSRWARPITRSTCRCSAIVGAAGPGLLQEARTRVIVESKLVQATRHVAEGRRIVAAQHALVAKKRAAGQDTAVAEGVLAQFERSLIIFESDLLAIQKEKDAK